MGCICSCFKKGDGESTDDKTSGLLGEESSETEDLIDFSSKNAKQVMVSNETGSVSKKLNVEDFIFLRVLGRGAFGKVVLVKKKDSGNEYAMKIIRKDSLTRKNQKLRTKAERDILEGVDCPFVVQLHYAFQSATKLYLIMDYMQGGELYYHYRKERKFKEPRVKFYVAEIVLGLEHLHNKGIIYRDLKLENILMDGEGHIKIADFGLSKQGIEGGKKTYSFCGTPDYLAPEILQSIGHDNAADYWSLGIMMYEMLAGYLPFRGNTTKDLFKNILEQPVDLKNKFSPEASSLIAAFLVTDPKKRLRNAVDIKNHEFFKDIDWVKLAARKLPTPFKPEAANDKKLNVDKKYLDEDIAETVTVKAMVADNNTFKGFTYVPNRFSMQIDGRPSVNTNPTKNE